jgi:hypothetical protein
MKKLLLTILTLVSIFSPSFAQTDSIIKSYSLKDYIAPEIKYQRFDLGGFINSNGDHRNENDASNNNLSGRFTLNYYNYINTDKYQANTLSGFSTSISGNNYSRDTTLKLSTITPALNLNYFTQNRFYKQNEKFWGVHGRFNYSVSKSYGNNQDDEKTSDFRQILIVTPYLSYGSGRLQPVNSARKSMEILLALEKYNRLAVNPDHQMIDSLAQVANRIRFKRFYDRRYKRIYQLKELDQAIQDLGLVDTLDMIYFANLSDIWSFAPNYNRSSGTRIEGGIIPDLLLFQDKLDRPESTINRSSDQRSYGIYGYVSFNKMKPLSYQWQSDLMIDITFGYENERTENNNSFFKNNASDSVIVTNESYLKGMINASWQFGYYPNTRTFASITPFATVSFFDQQEEDNANVFGINTGFQINSYYYISPRVRLTIDLKFYYFDNFVANVPTPFWNTVSYNNFDYRDLQSVSGNNISFGSVSRPRSGFDYRFGFALTYAIF